MKRIEQTDITWQAKKEANFNTFPSLICSVKKLQCFKRVCTTFGTSPANRGSQTCCNSYLLFYVCVDVFWVMIFAEIKDKSNMYLILFKYFLVVQFLPNKALN